METSPCKRKDLKLLNTEWKKMVKIKHVINFFPLVTHYIDWSMFIILIVLSFLRVLYIGTL